MNLAECLACFCDHAFAGVHLTAFNSRDALGMATATCLACVRHVTWKCNQCPMGLWQFRGSTVTFVAGRAGLTRKFVFLRESVSLIDMTNQAAITAGTCIEG
jgi:hypothetical protein